MGDKFGIDLRAQVVKAVVAVQNGDTVKDACAAAGISEKIFKECLRKGICDELCEKPPKCSKFRRFVTWFSASATAAIVLGGLIFFAGIHHGYAIGFEEAQCSAEQPDTDWTAAAAYLRGLSGDAIGQLDDDPAVSTKSGFFARGLYEQYIRYNRVKAYAYYSLAAADGLLEARALRKELGITDPERQDALNEFVSVSRRGGVEGHMRLGRAYLGDIIFAFSRRYRTGEVPFCAPNDFLQADYSQAYRNFEIARLCGSDSADGYIAAIERHFNFDRSTKSKLSDESLEQFNSEINDLAGGDRNRFCSGVGTIGGQPSAGDGINGRAQPGAVLPSSADQCEQDPWPYDQPLNAPPSASSSGANAARPAPSPASSAARPALPSGGRDDARYSAAVSRCYLKSGDAQLAIGDGDDAERLWSLAIDWGRRYGSQASLIAQKRLQIYTSACEVNPDSLAAISRDYKSEHGDLVGSRVIQQALHALGDYDGPLDGQFTPATRAAAAKFQREMELDETENLTPLETVYLICNAAQTARDVSSENMLGIMYATGLGVVQNTDLALEWFRMASDRRYADATFNLAVLYGSGIVLNSYRLCDIDRSSERADEYLREAAGQGNPVAGRLIRLYGGLNAETRWKRIEAEQLGMSQADKTGVYANRLKVLGARCAS